MGELFLHPSARTPDPLAEAHQRVDNDRRARHDHQRQLVVVVEHQARKAHDRQPFPQEIADRLRDRHLDLLDVVGDARQQLAARSAAEEGRRLIQDVPEQPVAQVADHALSDVGHQVGREVGPQPLEQIDHEDRDAPGTEIDAHPGEGQIQPAAQDAVHERFDEGDEAGRRRGVEQHGRDSRGEAPTVRASVCEQPRESVHSVNRYLNRTHSATKPSSHVIFFPSSYPRPS
jgi:hypothetical protein